MDKKQKERYNRHIIIPEVGEEGQEKILKARVLVVGAGGLGAPVLQYLTASGIGKIGIMDPDKVSLSNLQRQVLYKESHIGASKVEKACEALNDLNSDVQLISYPSSLDEHNAAEIISSYDVVVGATDNFASRRCIDEITKSQNIPYVHGSIEEFSGQVTVFNYKGGPSYHDLYPDIPEESDLPLGVMGVLPGIIGSLQACEVIKIILGKGEVLSGKLLLYDALEAKFEVLDLII